MALSALKKSLREEYLLKRTLMSLEDAGNFSLVIRDHLLSLPEFLGAVSVALYAGAKREVRTDAIFMSSVSRAKEVYYPKTDSPGERLRFFKVDSLEDLRPGPYGILEPQGSGALIDPGKLDLIIVPGICFDLTGSRIGYGKGYYDKELKGTNSVKVALAFHMQVSEVLLPCERHDVKMDILITERGVERF